MCFAPQRRALFHLIWPAGSAPAALASLLFDPPEPQIIGKTQCFATFLPFRASASSFFWLFLFSDLLSSTLLFSLPLPSSAFHLSILSEVWLLNFLRRRRLLLLLQLQLQLLLELQLLQLQLQLQLHKLHYTTQLQLHCTTATATAALHHTTSSSCGWSGHGNHGNHSKKTKLQPPFGPSVDSLCHPWFTATNLSYTFPTSQTSATALCGTTGIYIYMYILFATLIRLRHAILMQYTAGNLALLLLLLLLLLLRQVWQLMLTTSRSTRSYEGRHIRLQQDCSKCQ